MRCVVVYIECNGFIILTYVVWLCVLDEGGFDEDEDVEEDVEEEDTAGEYGADSPLYRD